MAASVSRPALPGITPARCCAPDAGCTGGQRRRLLETPLSAGSSTFTLGSVQSPRGGRGWLRWLYTPEQLRHLAGGPSLPGGPHPPAAPGQV